MIEVPGDKSISHRYAILAALAQGAAKLAAIRRQRIARAPSIVCSDWASSWKRTAVTGLPALSLPGRESRDCGKPDVLWMPEIRERRCDCSPECSPGNHSIQR